MKFFCVFIFNKNRLEDHFLVFRELTSAAQFNRGPPGFSTSSRLHFDVLLGRDDRIGYGDYLNYDNEPF